MDTPPENNSYSNSDKTGNRFAVFIEGTSVFGILLRQSTWFSMPYHTDLGYEGLILYLLKVMVHWLGCDDVTCKNPFLVMK